MEENLIPKSTVLPKQSLPLPTCQAAYYDLGQGFPLLFLHGFLGESDCWLPLMQALQANFRCIGLDLLGFGDSSKPKIRYDVAQEVAFVQQFTQQLGLDRFALVGHSFGGWVSAAYTIAHPHQITHLNLIAPAGIRDDEFCGRYNHLRPLLWPTPIVDWAMTLLQPIAHRTKYQAAFNTIRWCRQELQRQPAAKSFLIDRLRPEDAIDTVENQIHQIQQPTLVIAGEVDTTIPLWHCQTYADRIPHAQLTVLPQVAHDIPQTQATHLSQLLTAYLQPSIAH
jgi:pimeloyl-ACP methyl ester carboxylesterase